MAQAAERPGAKQDVPWLADIQRPPKKLPASAPRLSPLLVDDQGRPIATLAAWKKRREQLRRFWLDFLVPLEVDRTKPPTLQVIEEDRPEGVIRQQVRYEVEPGLPTEAYLLLGGDSADGDQSWPFIEAVLPVYRLYGEPARVGLFNHRKGHSVPPEAERRIYQWFDAYVDR